MIETGDRIVETRAWYNSYYNKKSKVRNSLRLNKEVLFQTLAMDCSIIEALRCVEHEPFESKVLDVGCGSGGDLFNLLRLSYNSSNITGIDILNERILEAKSVLSNSEFYNMDASVMQFGDNAFHLVFESTMFATLTDDLLSERIAKEMVRVCAKGGYIMLIDWKTPNPFSKEYKALDKFRLNQLFLHDKNLELVGIYKGALVPPLGRFLSKYLQSLYFLVQRLFPIAVGQVVYLIKKTN